MTNISSPTQQSNSVDLPSTKDILVPSFGSPIGADIVLRSTQLRGLIATLSSQSPDIAKGIIINTTSCLRRLHEQKHEKSEVHSTQYIQQQMPRLRLPFQRRLRYRRRNNIRMTLFWIFALALILLIAPIYVVYKPPNILIRYFQHRWPDVLWHVPTTKKIVALTIDDAPSEYTEEIMDVLKANNASATFFIIGSQASGRESTMRNLVLNDYELGNHAMHDEPSRLLSDAELSKQIAQVQTRIAIAYESVNVEQPKARLFRPGSGFFSTRMRELMQKIGYVIVLGGIYPHDPQIPYWTVNARHILSMARPGGIIICHDRRPWTAPMLRRVLPELRSRGYSVVTVSELVKSAR